MVGQVGRGRSVLYIWEPGAALMRVMPGIMGILRGVVQDSFHLLTWCDAWLPTWPEGQLVGRWSSEAPRVGPCSVLGVSFWGRYLVAWALGVQCPTKVSVMLTGWASWVMLIGRVDPYGGWSTTRGLRPWSVKGSATTGKALSKRRNKGSLAWEDKRPLMHWPQELTEVWVNFSYWTYLYLSGLW